MVQKNETDLDRFRLIQDVLKADKEELFQYLQELKDEALLAVLRNPALDENHLLTMLKRKGLGGEFAVSLYRSSHHLESYKVAFATACHPETPIHIAQTLFPRFYIFDLLKVCFIPGIAPDLRVLAERRIIQQLPTQPLGSKITLARRGTPAVIEALLMEGAPAVVEICLFNPRLREGAVHQFISSHHSTAETISMVARSDRWKHRPNIRLAILKNPRTPGVWFTLFLLALSSRAIKELLTVQRLTPAQKELLRKALRDRGAV